MIDRTNIELEVLLPPGDRDTVELIHALTWVKFRHSVGLKTLLEETRHELGVSENRVRAILQSGWRKVASLARQGKMDVWGISLEQRLFPERGVRFGNDQQQLTIEELNNCRYLTWSFDDRALKVMPRLERFKDTFGGNFQRRASLTGDQIEFARVFVGRHGLLDQFKEPSKRGKLRRASEARVRRAVRDASSSIGSMSPGLRDSLSRSDVMNGLIHKYGLSIRHGGEADEVWKLIVARFSKLGRSGPRPKPPTQ